MRVPRPQRQRADGPLRGPAARRRGAGRGPARPALPRGEGRPDVPDRHRGGRGRHGHRGAQGGSASPRRASSCSTSTSPTSTSTCSRTPGWRRAGTTPSRRSPSARRTASPSPISTDPRHAFIENAGVSFTAKAFSQWPEPLGLAALRDVESVREFADIARQEYVAVGIRAALHPTLDLATEPRWARQAGTFGQDPTLVTELGHGLPRRVPAGGPRAGQRRLHVEALPGWGPAEGRRGRPLPLRTRTGLSRWAVRRPPQAVPRRHRGRHRRGHALLRDAGRARDRRRADRGGRVRLQPAGRHRAAARAPRLRRGRRHRLGARQRQPRRRPGAPRSRLGGRAPRPGGADGADPRGGRGPVRW